MQPKLRVIAGKTLPATLALGLALASNLAHAEARQVGGNKATWDKACQKSSNCMPVGDVGGGVNGYFVHDGNGGGTSVWCDNNNCVADRTVKLPKDAARLLQEPVGQLGGAATTKPLTGNETPAMLLKLN